MFYFASNIINNEFDNCYSKQDACWRNSFEWSCDWDKWQLQKHYWTKRNAILRGQVAYFQWVWWLTCQFLSCRQGFVEWRVHWMRHNRPVCGVHCVNVYNTLHTELTRWKWRAFQYICSRSVLLLCICMFILWINSF